MASDPRTRFSAAADDYHRARPSYPPELIDWIVAASGVAAPARVADIGCGTGISTRLLAQRGYQVVGVDPNEAMLAKAMAAGAARYVRGEAAATGLASGSVALVSVAQAFHWFDIPEALAELRRILRPGGACAVYWNVRDLDGSAFLREYDGLLRAYSAEYEVLNKPDLTLAALQAALAGRAPRQAAFANVQPLDREGFRSRVYSSSYVIHGVADREGFDRELDALFERHQAGGWVEFAYRSVGLVWHFD